MASEIGILLFSAYLGGLLSATIFPSFSFENGVLVFHQGTGGGVHLIPFGIFQDSWRLWQQGNITYGLINLAGNIAVFVPMGFFLSLLWRRPSFWKALAGGFLLSLSIELIQLLPSGPLDRCG